MRRKTLANCLSSGLSISKEAVYELLDKCDISRTARGEQLTMEQFISLAKAYNKE